jgi:hypothetical protein
MEMALNGLRNLASVGLEQSGKSEKTAFRFAKSKMWRIVCAVTGKIVLNKPQSKGDEK